METCTINTPLGPAKLTGDEDGVQSVTVINAESVLSDQIPVSLMDCKIQLDEYFSGERQLFSLKLNPEGTDFQKSVWEELQNIPYGKTMSYLELSKKMGNVKSIRAVAAANGKNPLWIIIPCHRVIGSDGSLIGYAGGLSRKAWLLNHEQPYKQQSLF